MELNLIGVVVLSTLLFNIAFAQERIFGGEPIDITKAPYMVHFYHFISNDPNDTLIALCGGSILRSNLILTAAHCVTNEQTLEQYPPEFFHVISGTREGSVNPTNGTIHDVKAVFHHPKYEGLNSKSRAHNDVALLQLVDNIELGETSQLVELAHENERPAIGTKCKLAGWGKNPDHPDDPDLYQIYFNVISTLECYLYYPADSLIGLWKHEICAKAPGKNQCQGDSGGPLIDTTTNRQVGIVSYGRQDCTTGAPGVLARVTDNLNYINEVIEQTKAE